MALTPSSTLTAAEIYEIAYLAGGASRCIDTAVATMVMDGRLRVTRDGRLAVAERRPENAVEDAVLRLLDDPYPRNIHHVRFRLPATDEVQAVGKRLRHYKLLRWAYQSGGTGWSTRLWCTDAGRRVVADQRAALAAAGPATSTLPLALGGYLCMGDTQLQAAIFDAEKPARSKTSASDTSFGGSSCGGGSCGSGCGGGGCGGGGCGGGCS